MQTIPNVFANQIVNSAAKTAEEAPDNQSLIILITGFVVVFLVLLLLIGIIKVYSTIVSTAQSKAEKAKANKEKAKEIPATVVQEASLVSAEIEEGLDLQTVAVITAAVEAYYSKGKKVRITGIRPADTRKNQWASASLAQNIPAMRWEGLL